jgi:uncharacterized protein with gpF-like domain
MPRPARPRILRPVRPNLGVQAAYRDRMDAMIKAMHESIVYHLLPAYRENKPAMAADAAPAIELARIVRQLTRTWQRRFDEAAPQMADYFATAATDRADGALQSILRGAGLAVAFRPTPVTLDIYQATIAENVGLIKSIASQHLTEVEGLVMRSVQAGRDLGPLAKAIEHRYGVTRRRAALIARDQNNKATATITRARQAELGITKAKWVHSAAGKTPRPSHVAFAAGREGGPIYDVNEGAFIDGERIWPGELINCRCVSRPILTGLTI